MNDYWDESDDGTLLWRSFVLAFLLLGNPNKYAYTDGALQTQASKLEPWRSEAVYLPRSRLPLTTIPDLYEWAHNTKKGGIAYFVFSRDLCGGTVCKIGILFSEDNHTTCGSFNHYTRASE